VLPVFLNISLGTALLASGRQMAWAAWKTGLVVVGAAASFVVIPYFQARTGNGGIGAAWVTVAAEFGMLLAAFVLLPRGIFDSASLGSLLRTLAAAAAMAVVALLLASAPFGLAAAAALLAYGAVLVALGAVDMRDVTLMRETVRGTIGGSR
jgi:hypothetical protein